MGREGIEQTMQALEGIAVVAKAVREVTRDGKVNTADLPQLFTLLNNAGVIFEGIKGADKIDDEIKDLDGEEAKQLVAKVVSLVEAVK